MKLITIIFTLCVLCASAVIVPLNANSDGANERNNSESILYQNGPELILTSPLRTGGNNLFHSLILIPTLESAELMEIGKGYIHAGFDYAVGNFRKDNGTWLLDYDANLTESFVDINYGISNKTELMLSLTDGILAQDKRDLLLLKGNLGYFSGTRSTGLSDLVMGLKFHLMGSPCTRTVQGSSDETEGMPYTSSLGIWLKYPLAKKENILSSGGTDLSIAYIETDKIMENIFVHTQVGFTLTGDENVFEESIGISNPIFYGTGISWLVSKDTALIGQIQGNLNAFKGIKVLNKNPLSVQGGVRYTLDNRFFTEGSIGFGLNDASADFTMMFSLGTMF